jgi:hypothetical protein
MHYLLLNSVTLHGPQAPAYDLSQAAEILASWNLQAAQVQPRRVVLPARTAWSGPREASFNEVSLDIADESVLRASRHCSVFASTPVYQFERFLSRHLSANVVLSPWAPGAFHVWNALFAQLVGNHARLELAVEGDALVVSSREVMDAETAELLQRMRRRMRSCFPELRVETGVTAGAEKWGYLSVGFDDIAAYAGNQRLGAEPVAERRAPAERRLRAEVAL